MGKKTRTGASGSGAGRESKGLREVEFVAGAVPVLVSLAAIVVLRLFGGGAGERLARLGLELQRAMRELLGVEDRMTALRNLCKSLDAAPPYAEASHFAIWASRDKSGGKKAAIPIDSRLKL